MTQSFEVVEIARTFTGTPYKHQGRSKAGLDCIGFVIVTAHKLGLFEFDFNNYGRVPNGSLETEVEKHCTKLSGGLVEGALVLFKLSAIPHHCGIVTKIGEDWGIIHAYENVGKVREHRLIEWWRSKIVGVYALPEVNYRGRIY